MKKVLKVATSVVEVVFVLAFVLLMSMVSVTDDGVPKLFVIFGVFVASFVTLVCLDDPRRLPKHSIAIFLVSVMAVGSVFNGYPKRYRFIRKWMNRTGNSYADLYKMVLRAYDEAADEKEEKRNCVNSARHSR